MSPCPQSLINQSEHALNVGNIHPASFCILRPTAAGELAELARVTRLSMRLGAAGGGQCGAGVAWRVRCADSVLGNGGGGGGASGQRAGHLVIYKSREAAAKRTREGRRRESGPALPPRHSPLRAAAPTRRRGAGRFVQAKRPQVAVSNHGWSAKRYDQ